MLSNKLIQDYGCSYAWAYCDDTFSEDELQILNSETYAKNLIKAEVLRTEENNGIIKEFSDYRTSLTSFISASVEHLWLFEKLNAVIESINNNIFRYDLAGFDNIQYTKYPKDGYYNKHTDYIYGQILNSEQIHCIPLVRKLSLSVMLNDDYEGGDLVLHYDGRSGVPMEKKRGRIIFFASDIVHEVTPVTSGERNSLVIWVLGPPWK